MSNFTLEERYDYPAEATSTVAHAEVEKEYGRGHIGLVVLGSIAGGLTLGLALTLGVFAGGREDVITGAALIALAFGMLMSSGSRCDLGAGVVGALHGPTR